MRRELEQVLRRELVPIAQDHRERLEGRLLAEFDRHATPRAPRRPRWSRYAIAAVAVASLLTASQAPAELELEVGKRITVELSAPTTPDDVETLRHAVADAFHPSGRSGEMNARFHRREGGAPVLIVDVWGQGLGTDAAARERVRELPGMGSARVHVTSVRGRVRETVFGKLRHLFRNAVSPEELELARQQAIDELRRHEPKGAIDVDITVDDAAHVRVKKLKRVPAP